MTERQLQDAVLQLARLTGWLAFHAYDSRRSQPGFPDLVLVRGARVLWRELKSSRGRPTPAQREWLDRLTAAGQDAGIWRPDDWREGRVERELAARPQPCTDHRSDHGAAPPPASRRSALSGPPDGLVGWRGAVFLGGRDTRENRDRRHAVARVLHHLQGKWTPSGAIAGLRVEGGRHGASRGGRHGYRGSFTPHACGLPLARSARLVLPVG